MANGNRALAQKMAKHIQDKRYGGTPRKTWSLDTTPGNFKARGASERRTPKADIRASHDQIMRLAAHW